MSGVVEDVTVTDDGEWKPIEYDYESRYEFKCEYSKTGRAKCRRCGDMISKGAVRLAKPIKWRGGEYNIISSWQHLECTRVEKPKKFSAAKLVFGLSNLKATDRKAVVAELKKTGPPPHLKAIDPNDPNFIRDRELPQVPAPRLLAAELLPYQKEGLGWMLNQEFSHYRGGILADEMGMGKTIQALSLILAAKTPGEAQQLASFGTSVPAPTESGAGEGKSKGKGTGTAKTKAKGKGKGKTAKTEKTAAVNGRSITAKSASNAGASRGRARRKAASKKINYAEEGDSSAGSDFEEEVDAAQPTRSSKRTKGNGQNKPHTVKAEDSSPSSELAIVPVVNDDSIFGQIEEGDMSGPTLIVCPSSAMLQWRDEILKFTSPGCLRVVVFYNNREKIRARDLQQADVVLTTFPILEYDFRICMNKAKVPCQYCKKLYLARKLVDHQKYFCGPNSKRSEKQRLRERQATDVGTENLSVATKRGMATLKIGTSKGKSGENEKTRATARTRAKRASADDETTESEDSWEPSSDSDEGGGRRKKSKAKSKTKKVKKRGRASSGGHSKSGGVFALTPSGIYKSLMKEAGRPVHSRWTAATQLEPSTEPNIFGVGDRVECRWEGGTTFYPGVVAAVGRKSGRYDIEYDDGDKEANVPADLIRLAKEKGISSQNTSASPKVPGDNGTSDSPSHPSVQMFQVGDRVECQFEGGPTYYPGVIVKADRSGLYSVDYDDGDQETGVSAGLIKPQHPKKDAPTGLQALNDKGACSVQSGPASSESTAQPTRAGRARRAPRKCSQCSTASGALMYSAGKLLCMSCVDLNATAPTAHEGSSEKRGLKLPRGPLNRPRTPVVALNEDSSDEWTPPTKISKPGKGVAKAAVVGKAKKGAKGREGKAAVVKQSTTLKGSVKKVQGKKTTRARKGKMSPVSKAGRRGRNAPIDSDSDDDDARGSAKRGDGHSSADDDELLSWVVDDQEGVDLRQSTLHRVRWTRIILDEAHKIKARTNSTAKAAYNLHARFKWCLTGTPLQNRVGELYALIRFIKVDPFAYYFCRKAGCSCRTLHWSWHNCKHCGHTPMFHFSYFNKHVMNPIQRYGYVGEGRKAMLTLKNDVMDRIMLRRTKKERAADLRLPDLEVKVVRLTLSAAERDFYESIYKMTRAKFDTYVQKGTLLHNYAHIFELLARLRQAVNHPYLVVHGTYRGRQTLIPSRSSGAGDVCGICHQDIVSVGECSVSACHHTFHQHCISDHIKEQKYHVDQFNERLKEKRKQEMAAAKKSSKSSSRTTKRKKQPASSKTKNDTANFYTSCPVCYQPLTLTTVRGAATQQSGKAKKATDTAGVAEEELCVVCCDKRRDALLLDCGHMFTCNDCFNTMQKGTPKAKWTCPICRQKVRKVVVVGAGGTQAHAHSSAGGGSSPSAGLGRETILQKIKVQEFASSTKIEALASELKRIRDSPDAATKKSIVFSQYNRMIDLCEFRLKQLGLQTVKLMGYMPMKERRSVLHAFKTRPDIDVILMSLKAGGEGLNLQEAAQVFILDPWWNPQVEAQAIQRAHRFGQKHKVVAYKFVTEDSIEDRMNELSNRKQLMFEGTVDGSTIALSQLTSEDLKFLFTGT